MTPRDVLILAILTYRRDTGQPLPDPLKEALRYLDARQA